MQRRYATAYVFTAEPFGGNPVAVVLGAEGLTTTQMQALAAEFNYVETTFVPSGRNARPHRARAYFHLRSRGAALGSCRSSAFDCDKRE